jgi:hypothetical protein
MLAAPLDKLAPRRGGVKLRGARPWVDCAPNFRIELRFILSADNHEFYFYRESVASSSFVSSQWATGWACRTVFRKRRGPQASTVVPLGKHHLPSIEAVRV